MNIKVTGALCPLVYVGNNKNTLKNRTEQHLQDVPQKVQYDNNSDTFEAHFAQHFYPKPTPQQCR